MNELGQRVARAIEGLLIDSNVEAHVHLALKAHAEYLEERGLVVVPREPTEAMLSVSKRRAHLGKMSLTECWQAMIFAAQEEGHDATD